MYINKCVQCGYDYSGSGDSAHVCNPNPKAATSVFTKRPSFDKRIEELAEECYIERLHERGGRYMAFDKKTFAERIIAECIDKIEAYRIPVGNSASGELACEWTYAALMEIRDEIKEHFGIE